MEMHKFTNGVDVSELGQKAATMKKQPNMARFKFHVDNHWIDAGHNRTTIKSFYGAGEEHRHAHEFVIEADEPPILLGADHSANPVEHLLNSLASCMTTSLIYHAAIRGIKIEEVESTLEGDMDVRGFMGLANDVRKGFENIRVHFRIKSDAPQDVLEHCARFSPVFDVVSNGTNVEVEVETE
jgi:uncharacterized OsmC-like protein